MLFLAVSSYPGEEEDSEDILDVRIRSTGWKGRRIHVHEKPTTRIRNAASIKRKKRTQEHHRKKVSSSPISLYAYYRDYFISGTPGLQDSKKKNKKTAEKSHEEKWT